MSGEGSRLYICSTSKSSEQKPVGSEKPKEAAQSGERFQVYADVLVSIWLWRLFCNCISSFLLKHLLCEVSYLCLVSV